VFGVLIKNWEINEEDNNEDELIKKDCVYYFETVVEDKKKYKSQKLIVHGVRSKSDDGHLHCKIQPEVLH